MPKKRPARNFEAPAPFELHEPEGDGPFPLIFLTPILGRLELFEDLFLERRLARFFAAQGLACALPRRPIFEYNPARGLVQLEEYIQESLRRNAAILDFLIATKRADPRRLGTFGISFGAVINCLWAAREKRFRAHVFSLAGAGLPDIFISSQDPLMRSYLKAALDATGLDTAGLKAQLAGLFTEDTASAAKSVPKENVLLILALFDRIIGFRYGLDLREALGRPQTLYLPLGHYFSILAVPFLKPRIVSFFRARFGF